MASWNKRARLGVALFGLVVAALVYFGMNERQQAAAPEPPRRMDPKAIFEATAGLLERVSGVDTSFELKSDHSQSYADGSARHSGVTITVPKGEGRTFTITADEAYAGKGQVELQLTGNVRLQDSDGFFLTTDRGTYNQKTLIAHAPGAVSFGKGRMSGTGENVGYDQAKDTLTVASKAQVTTVDEAGTPVMQFTAGSATLDRIQHLLTLDTSVHVVRDEQMIDTDHAVARLAGNDDVITFVELRGNARVAGGGATIDSMSARDIDLDYTDDGQRLERTHLAGSAAIAMVGEGSAPGRQLVAETLDLDLAADGSLTRAVGDRDVRLDLPATAAAPGRSIQAQALDGAGEPGKGLTSATFTGDVTFSEQAHGGNGGAKAGARTARAQKLETRLASDAVTTATFTGDATFEEPGLKACAGRMDYQPDKGSLVLSGTAPGGGPIVAEEQIAIEAQDIGITLETRRMLARGDVSTRMGAPGRCRPSAPRDARERRASRMPGLLDEKGEATITAATLDYDGDSGRAVYTGRAGLLQGETSIHADTLTLEQATGNLRAAGNVTSKITMDGADSLGQSQELTYDDKTRRVSYASPPVAVPAPVAGAAPASTAAAPVAAPAATGRGAAVRDISRVQGPMGDLRANWIDIVLAAEGGKIARIAARSNVRLLIGTRDVTGGSSFAYDPGQEQYTMTGNGAMPVRLVDRQGASCREFSGRSLTFYKSTDKIVIDGQNINNTQIEPLACPAPTR